MKNETKNKKTIEKKSSINKLKWILPIFVFLILGTLMVFSARLPAVGSDTGAWGTVLNAFLNISHSENGSIKTGINISSYNLNVTNNLSVTGSLFHSDFNLSSTEINLTNIRMRGPTIGDTANFTYINASVDLRVLGDIYEGGSALNTKYTQNDTDVRTAKLNVTGDLNVTGGVYVNLTREIHLLAGDFIVREVAPPAAFDIGELTVYEFTNASIEYLSTTIVLPQDYEDNSNMTAYIWWAHNSTDVGNVSWCMDHNLLKLTDDISSTPGSQACISDTSSGTAHDLQKTDTLAIDSDYFTKGDTVTFKLYRNSTNVGVDTFYNNSYFIAALIEYSSDRLGDEP